MKFWTRFLKRTKHFEPRKNGFAVHTKKIKCNTKLLGHKSLITAVFDVRTSTPWLTFTRSIHMHHSQGWTVQKTGEILYDSKIFWGRPFLASKGVSKLAKTLGAKRVCYWNDFSIFSYVSLETMCFQKSLREVNASPCSGGVKSTLTSHMGMYAHMDF